MPRPDDHSILPFRGIALISLVFISPVFFGSVDSWANMFFCALIFYFVALNPQSLAGFNGNRFLALLGMILGCLFLRKFFSAKTITDFEPLLLAFAYAALFRVSQSLPEITSRKGMALLVLVCVAESIYAFFEVLSGHEMVLWRLKDAHHGFLTGTYFNRNHFAGLLQLGIGCTAGFLLVALEKKKIWESLVSFALMVFLWMSLVMTGSRMGILSMAGGFLIILIGLFLRKKCRHLTAITAGICVTLPLSFFIFAPKAFSRFVDREDSINLFTNDRWVAWLDAFRLLKDHWLLGVGLGGFGSVFPQYQSPKLVYGWTHAHNGYLELAAEIGLPLFLMLSAVFLSYLLRGIKNMCQAEGACFYYTLGLLSGLTSFLLHGISDFNFSIPANIILFLGVLGAWGSFAEKPASGGSRAI